MQYFPDVSPIKFEGPESWNPLAYRHYNPAEVVEGKAMADHLRFAVCYWHTFCGDGSDVFGAGTFNRSWQAGPQGGDAVDPPGARLPDDYDVPCLHAIASENVAENSKVWRRAGRAANTAFSSREKPRSSMRLVWPTCMTSS